MGEDTDGRTDPAATFVWTPEAGRVRDVIDMHELGVALYRQRMRREHPSATESDIEALTRAWLADQRTTARSAPPAAEPRTS